MPLDTVGDYIKEARILLQDQLEEPYRYPDDDIAGYIAQAFLECRRIRPDIVSDYFDGGYPEFTGADTAEPVPLDYQYRKAFLYYVVGSCQLRDDENNEDQRAAIFLNKFVSQLTTVAA